MDQDIRNKLRNVVTQCRRLLEDSISQELEGKYAIFVRKDQVTADPHAKMTHLSEEEQAARRDILDHYAHIKARGFKPKESLEQLVREIAFTHLNRLCAYKMMEAREVYVGGQKFREAVSRGVNSNGVKFYLAEHPEEERLFNTGQQDIAYRHYLDWLGGALSDEIGVLFNPNDPANRLYPRQKTLDEVLDLLNDGGIKAEETELREQWPLIWAQDETIGWVYQYFTPKELRDQARKESQAPRNSYELAFRNQFFTPRYVVEFLTDNTLGRIWYEMRKGETKLKGQCLYLVRRPTEIFLKDGEVPPEDAAEAKDDPSQEELLKIPVHIPHRPKKDPRELKILDPACGSGHFLLYCFDLLLTIYEEAYVDPDLGPALKKDYPTLDALKRDVPRLILAHNLHGIDIDLRASQIAALALWLRCQRAYQEIGLKKDRPKIARSNFVCAEPMPGEQSMLKEFIGQLAPKVLGQVVEVVFDKMKLAGEAGSLLKIEEEIRGAVASAKKQWEAGPIEVQRTLFDKSGPRPKQKRFNLSGVTDEEFFNEAEAKVIEALRNYAEKAQNGQRLQRRLFTEDAVRGFAFVDLCHKRFDVVLMNPPFGLPMPTTSTWIGKQYPFTKNDVYAAFIERGIEFLRPAGMLGGITARTGFFLSSFQKWREKIVLQVAHPVVLADLGFGVLDAAKVETAAYCLTTGPNAQNSTFIRLLDAPDKPTAIGDAIERHTKGNCCPYAFIVNPDSFRRIPGSPFAYWVSERIRQLFTQLPSFQNEKRSLRQGLATSDDFRFVRAWWEVQPHNIVNGSGDSSPEGIRQETRQNGAWVPVVKAGVNAPFYTELSMVALWKDDGKDMKEYAASMYKQSSRTIKNTGWYFKPGITWPSRPWLRGFFSLVPPGALFTHTGMMLFLPEEDRMATCCILNSNAFAGLLHLLMARGVGVDTDQTLKYETGYLAAVPLPVITETARLQFEAIAAQCHDHVRSINTVVETAHSFVLPVAIASVATTLAESKHLYSEHGNVTHSVITECMTRINDIAYGLYGFSPDERSTIESGLDPTTVDLFDAGNDEGDRPSTDCIAGGLVSYAIGCVFRRWNVEIACGSVAPASLPSPNHPLPIGSPGMLRRADRLPILSSSEDGLDAVIVDDPDHQHDVVRRVREVFEIIWKARAEAIENEACEILGVNELRDYFRRPGKDGFWDDHISRYSKSRRKAPIYWLLQSSKKNYAICLYYHRLDKDLLFKALVNYVEPKIRSVNVQWAEGTGQLEEAKAVGKPAKEIKLLQKKQEELEDFLSELRAFEDKLRRAANLHLDPDLNDGVVLNIAPLWELVPWKEARKYWDELMEGKYEWSSIGKQLREKGLVKT